jgi:hypothetical protein
MFGEYSTGCAIRDVTPLCAGASSVDLGRPHWIQFRDLFRRTAEYAEDRTPESRVLWLRLWL